MQDYGVLTPDNRDLWNFSANPPSFLPPEVGFTSKITNLSSKKNHLPWKIIHFSCKKNGKTCKKNHLPSKVNRKTSKINRLPCKENGKPWNENHFSCKVNKKASKENSLASVLDALIPLKNRKSWVLERESNEKNEGSARRERLAGMHGGDACRKIRFLRNRHRLFGDHL
jgi:hypothetical protein